MNYPNAGYVYAIQNRKNGNAYIGSTTNYKSRWHSHRSALRRGVHHSFILQQAWDKHGEDAFEFKLLVVCSKADRILYETRLMALQEYNVLRTPKECQVRGGWKHTEEFKSNMSAFHKGKKKTDEHRKNISVAVTGRKYYQAFKDKARQRQLGKSPSEETRRKLSLSQAGRKKSPEHIGRMRAGAIERQKLQREATLRRTQDVQKMVAAGVPVYKALIQFKMSSETYYKYVKLIESGATK